MNKSTLLESYCLVLLSAAVYGTCQEDILLPIICILISAPIIAANYHSKRINTDILNAPWLMLFLIPVLIGYTWRLFIPIPEASLSLMPDLIASLQSACLIIATVLCIKPKFARQDQTIQFFAWMTVTLSINVPFNFLSQIVFGLFCLTGIALILKQAWIMSQTESSSPNHKRNWKTYTIGGGLFLSVIIASIIMAISYISFETTFQNLLKYRNSEFASGHFLRMAPTMNLNGPGPSGTDGRPIMEVTAGKSPYNYLHTQIFDKYSKGTWRVADSEFKIKLPETIKATVSPEGNPIKTFEAVLFTRLEEHIPMSVNVKAISGKGDFFQDETQLIYSYDELPVRKFSFQVESKMHHWETLTEEQWKMLTDVPKEIKQFYNAYAKEIIGDEQDPFEQAVLIRKHFQNNFEYTLRPNFKGDEQGHIDFLKYKKPAYCSYFASAMVFLLRTQNIPARIATGFLTDEIFGKDKPRYLVRVRDAHAWVEALIPEENSKHHPARRQWIKLDPTPGRIVFEDERKKRFNFNFSDVLWRWQKIVQAEIFAFDTIKYRFHILTIILILIALYIIQFILRSQSNRFISTQTSAQLQNKQIAQTQSIFNEFEISITKKYRTFRKPSETPTEWITHIALTHSFDNQQILPLINFIKLYNAARFGQDNADNLAELLHQIQQHKTKP